MNKSVAIVGASRSTRDKAPYDDSRIDIWSVNEACAWPWFKRASAMFQMHRRVVFTRSNNSNDPDHWRWLQQEHDFPIYMGQTWPDIPASVQYPWKGVIEYTRPLRKFFTSSVPFQIALAITLGYDWIGLFGIEQAMGTEWAYQRDCTTYWIGKAEGFGVEVYLPKECTLLRAKVYGYEAESMLSRHFFERRANSLDKLYEESAAAVNVATGKLRTLAEELEIASEDQVERLTKAVQAAAQEERDAVIQAAAAVGRREENKLYMRELDELLRAEGIVSTDGDYSEKESVIINA